MISKLLLILLTFFFFEKHNTLMDEINIPVHARYKLDIEGGGKEGSHSSVNQKIKHTLTIAPSPAPPSN